MQLFGAYLSPFTSRVMLQITAKGLDIPLVPPPDGLKSEAYLSLNPMGKIPALDTGSGIIAESAVICEFLEDTFPETPLGGSTAAERAQIRLIAQIFDLYIMNAMLPIFGQMDPTTRDQAVVDATVEACLQGLGFAEAHLDGSSYAVGGKLTLADCIAAQYWLTREAPANGSATPNCGRNVS
ncbi:MAG: glutathione S-transferase family protein, partial [Pseudomonadota bacterium]